MVMLLPSRGSHGGPELLVGAMGARAHDRCRRSEYCGSLLDAEPFLLEENVRDPVLLRHVAQLARQNPSHIAGSNRSLRGVAVVGMQPCRFGRIVRRAEILGATPAIP